MTKLLYLCIAVLMMTMLAAPANASAVDKGSSSTELCLVNAPDPCVTTRIERTLGGRKVVITVRATHMICHCGSIMTSRGYGHAWLFHSHRKVSGQEVSRAERRLRRKVVEATRIEDGEFPPCRSSRRGQ